MSKYTNSVVVIAGGASGIGEHIARQLVGIAKAIIIIDRDEAKAKALLLSLAQDTVLFLHVDAGNEVEMRDAVQHIISRHGSLDVFINLAGSFMAGEMRDTPLTNWRFIYEENMAPILTATEVVYAHMRQQGHGVIANTASAAGLFPVPAMQLYGSTKSAIVSLTLGLRMEAKDFNIDVSVICPTIIDTPLYDRATYNRVNKQRALKLLRDDTSIQQPSKAAARIIKGIAKNQPVIHTAFSTMIGWTIFKISPRFYELSARRVLKRYRSSLRVKEGSRIS